MLSLTFTKQTSKNLANTTFSIRIINNIVTSATPINTDSKWIMKRFIIFYIDKYWSRFKGTHFILSEANDPPKLNKPINIFLTNPNILHYAFSLKIHEYLKYHQPQYIIID